MRVFLSGTFGLFEREMRRWLRQRIQVVFAFIIPVFWLALFGKSFNLGALVKLPPEVPVEVREEVQAILEKSLVKLFGSLDYFSFFAVGMLSVFALFTSMWSGMSLVFDRRLGYLERFLAAPIPRASIYYAKVSASLAKGILQFTAMLVITFLLGLKPKPGLSLLDIFGVYLVVGALILSLSAIFTAIAVRITSHDLVISVANLLNLPLMFTSNAIFPVEQMPWWLRLIASVNPLTHSITLTRFLILGVGGLSTIWLNASYLLGFLIASLAIGAVVADRYL